MEQLFAGPQVILTIVLGILLLALFYFLLRRAEPPQQRPDSPLTDEDSFVFEPDDDNTVAPTTRRRVVIKPTFQNVSGGRRTIAVDRLPLIGKPPENPPPHKGIDEFITEVINPRVRYADDLVGELNVFDPPLTITVQYTREDYRAVPHNEDGKPQLSIITYYKPLEGGWRWEKLTEGKEVTFDPATETGTVSANLYALQPSDPVSMGRP